MQLTLLLPITLPIIHKHVHQRQQLELILLNKNARIYSVLDRKHVVEMINDHLYGKKNRRLLIWSLLNVELFLIENRL